jgi:hypothetical protein
MAATETKQRSIIRGCKYRPIARIVQHDMAKAAIGQFLWKGKPVSALADEAEALRAKLADDDFERDTLDHNADYIERFVDLFPSLDLPKAEMLAPGAARAVEIEGVRVTADLRWRMRRTTKTNKVKMGAGTLRYKKGRPLGEAAGCWQSAFLFGYLSLLGAEDGAEVEHKLCITLDAFAGVTYAAPTNSVQRFNQMRSACATIAERWDNIAPPTGAVF